LEGKKVNKNINKRELGCGWMQVGVQIDLAERGARILGEEVTAEGIQPHIIRLVPSKLVPIADLQRQ
jgi:hypothetical protein